MCAERGKHGFYVALTVATNQSIEYKYTVDGQACHAPTQATVTNSFGSLNNSLQVPAEVARKVAEEFITAKDPVRIGEGSEQASGVCNFRHNTIISNGPLNENK